MASIARAFNRACSMAPLAVLLTGGAVLAQSVEAPDNEPANEPDNEFAVWAGYGDSDNIGRTTIQEAGSYRSVGLYTALARETTRLDADIYSDIEYRRYSLDSYDSETVGTLEARALVDIVDDRFAWNFEENFDQGQQYPFAAIGPNNREAINVIAHGPRLTVPFGRTSLIAGANRSKRRFDESTAFDNESDSFELALARQARRTAVFALVAGTSETEYDDNLAPEYDIEQFFVRIEKEQRAGALNLDVGTNEITSEAQSRRDPLLNLAWSRALNPRSTFGITAVQGYTDSGNDLNSVSSVLVTATPFEQKRFDVSYSRSGSRMSTSIGISSGEEDYAGGTSFDNDFKSARVSLRYAASMRLDIGFRYLRNEREFLPGAGPSTSQDERVAGVWLNRRLGRKFGIALDVSRYEGEGSESVDETRTEIRLGYSPTGSTSSSLGLARR